MNNLFKILVALFIGVEIYLLNSNSILIFISKSELNKISVFCLQSGLHSFILYFIFKIFNIPKKDSLKIKLSFVFCITLMSFGGFRILINTINISNYETWVLYITTFYHFVRSPNVFAIIIPTFIVIRKQINSTPNEI